MKFNNKKISQTYLAKYQYFCHPLLENIKKGQITMSNPFFQKLVVYPISDANPKMNQVVPVGGGKKGLGIVFFADDQQKEALIAFLDKIITAIGYQLQTDCWLWIAASSSPIDWRSTLEEYPLKKIIAFGMVPEQLNLAFPYQPFVVEKQKKIQYLFTPPLLQIYTERQSGDKTKASQLWQALKEMFHL